MIPEIDTRPFFESTISDLPRKKEVNADFQSILKGRMENSAPLEKIALEFLRRALESAFSGDERGEDPVFTLPPFFPLFAPGRQEALQYTINHSEPDSVPAESAPDPQVSNNFPEKPDFESIIRDAGTRYGVDPALIRAVIQAESGGNPLAVSRAGAKGLMQLMPETAAELGVRNVFDPYENVMGGTRYLSRLLDRYRGDVRLALAGYNWGMGNLEKRPESMPAETKNYINKVEGHYRMPSKV